MQALYTFAVDHEIEIVLAVVFAAVFAVIVDFLQPASRLRAAVRHFKNKLAEQSVALLRKRIADMEAYRNRVAVFLESDKALYMATLQYIAGMLLLMCVAAFSVLIDVLSPRPGPGFLGALLALALALVLGVYGVRTAFWDTRSKVAEVVSKLDGEIAEMRAKLDARTK